MKTPATIAIAVAGLCACGSPPGNGTGKGPVCGSGVVTDLAEHVQSPTLQSVQVGMPVGLFFTAGPGPGCDNPDAGVSVTTEILDADGRPVPHPAATLVFEIPDAGPRFRANLSFNPPRVGVFHVRAQFEPAMGAQEANVIAFAAGPGPQAATFDVFCASLETLPSGLVLCLERRAGLGHLVLFRDGMRLPQEVRADEFAVAGGVVWTVETGNVQRFVDVGGPTPLMGSPRLTVFPVSIAYPQRLQATADHALVFDPRGVVRLGVDAGSVVEERRLTAALAAVGVASADLERMLLVREKSNRVCEARFEPDGGADFHGCSALGGAGTEAGSTDTGMWIVELDALLHISLSMNLEGPPVLTRLGLPKDPPPFTASTHVGDRPVLRTPGSYVVLTFGPDGIGFDGAEVPAGFELLPSPAGRLRAVDVKTNAQLFYVR